MATSSSVMAATLSFAVEPPLKATLRVSPTVTWCFLAYSEPTDMAFVPYAADRSPAVVSRRRSWAYVGSAAVIS